MTEQLVEQARRAAKKSDKGRFAEIVEQLGDDTESLVELIPPAMYDSSNPALEALVAAPAGPTSVQVAERMLAWSDDPDLSLAISRGAEVLARRGDAAPIGLLREIGDRVSGRLTLRGLLVARIVLGDDRAPEAFHEWAGVPTSTNGFKEAVRDLLRWGSVQVVHDTLSPYVTWLQEGRDEYGDAAAIVLVELTTAERKWIGQELVTLPPRPADPRWFELGLTVYEGRPHFQIQPYLPRLLQIPHPDRVSRLAAALEAIPGARTLRRMAEREGAHPLLEGVDPELARRHDLARRLCRHEGGWELRAASLSLADIDAILDGLGAHADPVGGLVLGPGKITAKDIKELAAWSTLARFRALDLGGTRAGTQGVRALLKSPHLAGLESLGLEECNISVTAIKALGKATSLPALRALHLGVGDGDRASTPDVVSALASAPALQQLERLSLRQWDMELHWRELAASDLGRNLLHLDLSGQMTLGGNAAGLLDALAEHGGRLETLVLAYCFRNLRLKGSWNQTSGRPVRPLTSLRHLVLDHGSAVTDDLRPLVDAWFFPRLHTLSLAAGGTDQDALEVLLSGSCPEMRSLCMRDNPRLDHRAVATLAAWPQVQQIESLDLGGGTHIRAVDLRGIPDAMRNAVVAAGWPD